MTAEEKKSRREKLILERETLVNYAKELKESGMSASDIAHKMCLAESTIRSMLAKLTDNL